MISIECNLLIVYTSFYAEPNKQSKSDLFQSICCDILNVVIIKQFSSYVA